MSRVRKPQQRSTESATRVLAAARERFAVDGFDLVTIDAIAADCGRTKGAVYHHFVSKEALFEAVFGLEQRRIADVVVSQTSSTDPVVALQDGLATYLTLIASDPQAARITLVDAPGVLGWQKWRSCDDGPFRALLTTAVRSIGEAGRLRDGLEADLLAELLLGATTEAALAVATSGTPPASFTKTTSQLIEHITTP